MNNIDSLLLTFIYLVFPIIIYLIFLKHNKITTHNNKISFVILISLILLLRYKTFKNIYVYLFYNIPLLLAYIFKNKKMIIMIILITTIYIYKYNIINIKISIIVNIIYLLIYFINYNNIKINKIMFTLFIISQSIIVSIYIILNFANIRTIITLIINIIFYIIYSYITIYLLKLIPKIIEENKLLNELRREKNLKNSIFKLTHELKNPLSVCNGYLDMIDTQDKIKRQKYFSIIKDEIKRSLTIINDFSSYGKIKELEKEEIDLYLLLEEVYEIFNLLYEQNNAKIILPKSREIYIYADYNRLKQVLINIIKNSLESKKTEKLYVNIKLRKIKNNIKITINDNGCGMTKEQLNHIGEIFYTTKQNGTGLGISYCKEIISLHRGTINYKSNKQKGTIVTIILPT